MSHQAIAAELANITARLATLLGEAISGEAKQAEDFPRRRSEKQARERPVSDESAFKRFIDRKTSEGDNNPAIGVMHDHALTDTDRQPHATAPEQPYIPPVPTVEADLFLPFRAQIGEPGCYRLVSMFGKSGPILRCRTVDSGEECRPVIVLAQVHPEDRPRVAEVLRQYGDVIEGKHAA